ncbi:SIS domain-containing protein [candidate division KSB1 bacterium]
MEEKEYRDKIGSALHESAEIKKKIADECIGDIIKAAKIIVNCFSNGNKVLLCGNGGSAADAQHIAAEFVVRLTSERNRRALPAISLGTDTSIITACSNDYGFESIFLRQVEALGSEGDVLIGITTSGNSPNVINAIQKAKEINMKTIAFLGAGGGKVKGMSDVDIVIPGNHVCRIQEGQSAVGHILCDTVESMMFEEN